MILIVIRRNGRFQLHECSGLEPVILVQVQADDAQGIQDYAESMFAAGTPIHWCIQPADPCSWVRIPSAMLERVA